LRIDHHRDVRAVSVRGFQNGANIEEQQVAHAKMRKGKSTLIKQLSQPASFQTSSVTGIGICLGNH